MSPTTLAALMVALKSSTPVADPSAPRDNPHGLPSGKPIASLMRKTFRRMATETRAWLEMQPGTTIPANPPSLKKHIRPLAKALAKRTLPYRREAGAAMLEALGLPSGWSPSTRANDERAAFAAASIVATTEDELRAALDALREAEDAESSAKGLGGLLTRAWDALKGVFRRGEEVRAETIAELEASEAVNAAAIEAVTVATSNQAVRPRKRWLVDGAPCEEICIPNMRAGLIPLGKTFPSGHSWPPAHPSCKCACGVEDVKVGPKRIRKR